MAVCPPIMISDSSLVGLRCAAAMAAAVPSVKVRVHANGQTVLDVSRDARCEHAARGHDSNHPREMGVTTFHNAVSMAHTQRKAGQRLGFRGLGFRGLDEADEPVVAFAVEAGDLVTPGSILRVTQDGRWLHLAALAGRGDALDELIAHKVTIDDYEVTLAAHDDPWVEVTIVHIATDIDDRRRSSIAFEALHDVAARAMVLELEAFLDPLGSAIAPPSGSTGL